MNPRTKRVMLSAASPLTAIALGTFAAPALGDSAHWNRRVHEAFDVDPFWKSGEQSRMSQVGDGRGDTR